mgnify:FL=1
MAYDPWMLNAMEEYGCTDTNDGLINRVAVEIQRTHPSGGNIADDEFRRACLNCGVNPSSFTQSDIEKLTRRLNRG